MKLAISTALLSLPGLIAAAFVPRQMGFCPEALQFGIFSVSPTTVNPGDEITIFVNLSCSINQFGIRPRFLDFTLFPADPDNPRNEPHIVLARRDFNSSTGLTSDQFTAKIPTFPYVVAPQIIFLTETYPITGTDGSEVLIQGGISTGITINVNAA